MALAEAEEKKKKWCILGNSESFDRARHYSLELVSHRFYGSPF